MVYADERGEIRDIADGEFRHLQIITSKKGAIRGNHYHKTGGHLCYVISGSLLYHYGRIADKLPWTVVQIRAGEQFFTGHEIAHAMEFLEDTVMLCASTGPRIDGAYEDDLVRVTVR